MKHFSRRFDCEKPAVSLWLRATPPRSRIMNIITQQFLLQPHVNNPIQQLSFLTS